MNKDFLNLYGEIERLNFTDIQHRIGREITWEKMHTINKHTVNTKQEKQIHDYIKRYIGKVSIFDFNNMIEWEYLYLPRFYVTLALKNGAIDKRSEIIKRQRREK